MSASRGAAPEAAPAPRAASAAPAAPPCGCVGASGGVVLHTPRLRLVAASVLHVVAELAGGDALARVLGAAVPASWPPGEYDAEAQRLFLACLVNDGAAGVGWYGWYAVRRADAEGGATVVAAGGFAGPPDDDDDEGVELWFSVCPEWTGRGYAREFVRTLAAHAALQPCAPRVFAHALPGNQASHRVLADGGFAPAGTNADTGALRFAYRPASA